MLEKRNTGRSGQGKETFGLPGSPDTKRREGTRAMMTSGMNSSKEESGRKKGHGPGRKEGENTRNIGMRDATGMMRETIGVMTTGTIGTVDGTITGM